MGGGRLGVGRLLVVLSLILKYLRPNCARGPILGFGGSNGFGVMRFASMRCVRKGPGSTISLRHVGRILSTRGPSLILFANSIVCNRPTRRKVHAVLGLTTGHRVPFKIAFNGRSSRRKLAHARLFSVVRAVPCGLASSITKIAKIAGFVLPLGSSSKGGSTTVLCYVSSRSCSRVGKVNNCSCVGFSRVQ